MPGKWHNEMESKFPEEMREVKFFCSSKNNNTCRRADIVLSDKRTCEIQHSFISEREIIDRFNDWLTFGKEIYWLIDGNEEDVVLDKLSNGNYLIIFNKAWKYKSFRKKYDYVLLDIKGKIFKIALKKISCKMIVLKEFKPIDTVVELLKNNPEGIWDLWEEDDVIRCKLYVHQQGAGNGKTYGIWKSICENEDKKTYIIVTKQHSAKNVIYEELKDQSRRGDEYHIENLTEKTEENTVKHYVVKYTHKKSKRECIVIIGTIDSLIYNLSSGDGNSSNMFENILSNITKNGPTKVTQYGYMRFGGQNIFINKQCEIWIDEVQDLPESYLHGMTKVMLETGCDIHIVGDKLQSLAYENNFLTSIANEGLPNIKLIKPEASNNNRRIKVSKMHKKINELINFEKYNLPEIEPEIDCSGCELEDVSYNVLEIIDSPAIYANDTDNKKINLYVDIILKKVEYEVDTNNYVPEDFMFIFPIMKKNIIARELYTKLTTFWIEKFKDDEYKNKIKNEYWRYYNHNEYTQYVYLHKHQPGQVINTKDSVNASRIMSIRTSKGDGRNVVFALGINERSLKKCSGGENNLMYESHLHVALTRAKRKIYFGLVKNNDEIHRRFGEAGLIEYLPRVKKNLPLDIIIENLEKDNMIKFSCQNEINPKDIMPNDDNTNNEPKETVDWGYHCIKRATAEFAIIMNIIDVNKNNSYFMKTELGWVINELSGIRIKLMKVKEFYKFLNENQYKKLDALPLCILSNKPNYEKYQKLIFKTMKKVQKSIKNKSLRDLSVYESVIMVYMIQIYRQQKYADITPPEVYNITHFFQCNISKEKELFDKVKNIKSIIKNALHLDTKMKWNILKHIAFNGSNDDFKISKLQFPIIGNNETDVTHIMLKSTISEINFWDIMIEVLLERFLIYNPRYDLNKKKFGEKKITTYIFLLDNNKFIKLNWRWDSEITDDLKIEIKKSMEKYFSEFHKPLFKYLSDIKEKKNKGKYWGHNAKSKTPFDYIYTKLTKERDYPKYIIAFFKDLHEKWKMDKKEDVRTITKNKESFIDTLNNKLSINCESYLNLSTNEDDDDDDDF